MKHILVTGSTGFIGRRLIAHIRERWPDAEVSILVKAAETPSEAAAFSRQKRDGARIIFGDLARPEISDDPPPPVDVLFHLAANIDTAASEEATRVNDVGTTRLFDWLGDRLRGSRVVFTSSIAVCDPIGPDAGPVDESSPCRPRTPYGRTKLAAEALIRDRAAKDGYTYTIVRLPTVFGVGQKPGGMFDLLMTSARRGSLVARLNWPGRTSVVYIEDVARVLIEVAAAPAAADHTFCVATDETMSVGEISRRIGTLIGHPVRPIDLSPRLWHSLRWFSHHERIAGWVPAPANQAYWRLSLVVADGFLQSGRKLQSLVPIALRSLDDGVKSMLASETAADRPTG